MNSVAVTLILAVLLAFAPSLAEARVEVEGFDEAPLYVPDEATALNLVRLAIGRDYRALHSSRKVFRVAFESKEEIAAATDLPAEYLDRLGAYFEKDLDSRGLYTIHVNRDWVVGGVKKGIADAGDAFASLPEAERQRRELIALRLGALTVIAHEAQHAMQTEFAKVGFKETLVAPAIHDKIAHDKYDEYEGYVAQKLAAPRLLSRDVPAEADIRDAVVEETDREYRGLTNRFLVVRGGEEREARAPFAWAGGATDAKSYDTFMSALANIASGGEQASSDAGTGRDEAEVLGGTVAETAQEGFGDGGDEGADDGELARVAEQYLGDPGFEVPEQTSRPVEALIAQAAAGESPDGETMMAKTTAPVAKRRGEYGADATAGELEP